VQLYLRETEFSKLEMDLNTDLKDGRIIAQLISVLANKPLSFKLKPSENKLQCVGNLQQALAFIADQGIRLSVGPEGTSISTCSSYWRQQPTDPRSIYRYRWMDGWLD